MDEVDGNGVASEAGESGDMDAGAALAVGALQKEAVEVGAA